LILLMQALSPLQRAFSTIAAKGVASEGVKRGKEEGLDHNISPNVHVSDIGMYTWRLA